MPNNFNGFTIKSGNLTVLVGKMEFDTPMGLQRQSLIASVVRRQSDREPWPDNKESLFGIIVDVVVDSFAPHVLKIP